MGIQESYNAKDEERNCRMYSIDSKSDVQAAFVDATRIQRIDTKLNISGTESHDPIPCHSA